MNELTQHEKDRIKQEIQLLLDASRFEWSRPRGLFGQCYNWVDEYNRQTSTLQRRLALQMKQYFQVKSMYWDVRPPLWFIVLSAAGGGHPVEAWDAFDPGHAAIQIEFKDGTTIYLDDGNIGGGDHVFV
jgi:hypothetical protein